MSIQVIGISGSPIKNSNTDRVVQAMLEATGCETEFVKLSDITVRPCMGCKGCVKDNLCKVDDDFPALAQKIREASGLILGGYTPYGQIDGFTKALLERFWSFRHVNNLLKGKLSATVLTCLAPDLAESTNHALKTELVDYEGMKLLGQITLPGNLPCLSCGKGDICEMSGVAMLYGADARTEDYPYHRAEDETEIWNQALAIGRSMGERIRS